MTQADFDFFSTRLRIAFQESRNCAVVSAGTAATTLAAGTRASAAGAGAVGALGGAAEAEAAAGAAFTGSTLAAGGASLETVVTAAVAGASVPAMPMRRSSLSMRASEPTSVWSAAGTSTRPIMSSRCSLGLVAPDIWVSASLTTSAACESSAEPKREA